MPKVTIGLPVFNGEKYVRNALTSLLSQTFSDFELIISDNASTDSTQMICEEFANEHKRIKYFRQKNNIGIFHNYKFVLKQASCDYFQWAAADDLWDPTFLEKNICILKNDDTLIGSIGAVELYDTIPSDWCLFVKNTSIFNLKFHSVKSMFGSYSKKISEYLKLRQVAGIYGVYRTDKLRKSISHIKGLYLWDFEIVLSTIKFGNFYVIDEILMYKYNKGLSGDQTPLDYALSIRSPIHVILFPHLFFTIRCIKQFGMIASLQNFHLIFRYFAQGQSQLFLDIIALIKRKI